VSHLPPRIGTEVPREVELSVSRKRKPVEEEQPLVIIDASGKTHHVGKKIREPAHKRVVVCPQGFAHELMDFDTGEVATFDTPCAQHPRSNPAFEQAAWAQMHPGGEHETAAPVARRKTSQDTIRASDSAEHERREEHPDLAEETGVPAPARSTTPEREPDELGRDWEEVLIDANR
jgi:hypothetical protein